MPELEKIPKKKVQILSFSPDEVLPYNHDDFDLEKEFIQQGLYYDVPHFSKKLFKNVLLKLSSTYLDSY